MEFEEKHLICTDDMNYFANFYFASGIAHLKTFQLIELYLERRKKVDSISFPFQNH